MAKPIRFLMIGGFLGAGKTTVIGQVARRLVERGVSVGVITNDQGYGLVDTRSLRAQGFRVGEVPGACFCCRFDDLLGTIEELRRAQLPDVVLAEPVGSCTDLVATVIEPLRRWHGEAYSVGPLVVLLKPEHGRAILRRAAAGEAASKAGYLFLKQLEEADLVAVNKIDALGSAERDELVGLVGTLFPGTPVLAISARRGDGLDDLIARLERAPPRHAAPMDVDYDLYAAAEAELGWLNGHLAVTGPAFALDELLVDLVTRLRRVLQAAGAEPAHLKVLGTCRGAAAVCHLTAGGGEIELSGASEARVEEAELLVNARVATHPDALRAMVRSALGELAVARGVRLEEKDLECFRPARPVPTHRLGAR